MAAMKTALRPSASEQPDTLLSRRQVAARWSVSTETIKRRSRDGILAPLRFNQRLLRYRLADVIRAEEEASTNHINRQPTSNRTN